MSSAGRFCPGDDALEFDMSAGLVSELAMVGIRFINGGIVRWCRKVSAVWICGSLARCFSAIFFSHISYDMAAFMEDVFGSDVVD